jgi:hypothetical protein
MATDVKVQIFNVQPEQRIITCPHCRAKQRIHVRNHGQTGQMVAECVRCFHCNQQFIVMVPYEIVTGPFPA